MDASAENKRSRARDLVLALVKAFGDALRADLDDNLLSLALYGSFARGDFVLTSDLDLLIVLRSAAGTRGRRIDLVLPAILRARESDAWRELRTLGYSPDFAPLIYRADELANTPAVFVDAANDAILVLDTGALAAKLEQVRARLKELGAKKVIVGERNWYWILKPDLRPGEAVKL